MDVKTLKEFYARTDQPIECITCGNTDNLTVDHLVPKSVFNRGKSQSEKELYHAKMVEFRRVWDPQGFKNYALMCGVCNLMKHHLPLRNFIAHVFKINKWIMNYEKNHPAQFSVRIKYPFKGK